MRTWRKLKVKMPKIKKDEDPIGLIVRMEYRKRTLLGQVVDCGRDKKNKNAYTYLYVNHFNGEPWPVQPLIWEVDVLERDQFSAIDPD